MGTKKWFCPGKAGCILMILVPAFMFNSSKVTGQPSGTNYYPNTVAYILVTGMKLNEDPKNFMKDISVAEGAIVKLTAGNGNTEQKTTMPFTPGRNPGDLYYTADFKIEFDSTYTIEMTFRDGTMIRMENFSFPSQWKTHFYFHSTNGTKSPASVMRRKEDRETKLNCIVYGLYPLNNYKALGGNQFDE